MNDCIFCKIGAGEIPVRKVYEDDKVIAFLDRVPISLGHTLVVPKQHFENFAETSDEALAYVMAAARTVAAAAMTATGAQGYNVGVNCGAAAGQDVMHTHVHLIPRHANDGLPRFPKAHVTDEQMDQTAAGMAKLLSA